MRNISSHSCFETRAGARFTHFLGQFGAGWTVLAIMMLILVAIS
jgi:hypothetical protein